MTALHVLVVEDDPDGADMVRMMLNSVGVTTTLATSGEAALSKLDTAPGYFNASIVDLALPEMDGLELMHQIRQKPEISRLPLIAVTAYHTPELKIKALDAGFDAYFAKPLDTTLFMRALERLLTN